MEMYVDWEKVGEAYDCEWTGHYEALEPDVINRAKSLVKQLPLNGKVYWKVGRAGSDNVYISSVFGCFHLCLWVDPKGLYSGRLFHSHQHDLRLHPCFLKLDSEAECLEVIKIWMETIDSLTSVFTETYNQLLNKFQ
jgi:hypothetical protein